MTDPADRRPGLPAADLHERIREAAFALLLTERKPIAAAEIASTTDVSAGTLPAMLDQLARAGWIDRDEEGRVTGSAGLSLTTGPHRVAIDGTEFRTWCAYDSIGIAAALRADAAIRAQCAVCGAEIALDTRAGRPPASRSERLWLASGGGDLRGDRSVAEPPVRRIELRPAEPHRQVGAGLAGVRKHAHTAVRRQGWRV